MDRAITRRDFLSGVDPRVAGRGAPLAAGPPALGRIAIANGDAADYAMAEASFGEAYRAVREVLRQLAIRS
jgi:hypothetical protein